jgi:hypothetical protein
MILQSSIKVQLYEYVEKDPQVWQASMHHIMMLWQHPYLLPTLVVQSDKNSLSKNIILLSAQDLDKNGLVDSVILRWPCQGLS